MGAYGSPELYPYNSDDNNNKKKDKKNTHIAYKILMFVIGIVSSILSSLTIGFPIITIWLIADIIIWVYEEVHGSTKMTKILWKIQGWIYLILLLITPIVFGLAAVGERLEAEGGTDHTHIESEYTQETEPVQENRAGSRNQSNSSRVAIESVLNNIDWKAQAVSRAELKELLVERGYIETERDYVLDNIDWNTQALNRAHLCLDNYKNELTRKNLKEALTRDEFTETEIDYAISNIDWNAQAMRVANHYINMTENPITKVNLKEALTRDGFTETEIVRALRNDNIDWNEQAVRAANWYLDIYKNGLDRETLKEALTRNGFTGTEAEYALSQVGL